MKIKELIAKYQPFNDQERQDQQVILQYLQDFDNLLSRDNVYAHFTSTGFVVNERHDEVLMAFHNQYQSYSWTGGHNDGMEDCLAVTIKEVEEETGIHRMKVVSKNPIALDILPVWGHMKKGKYVSSHQHLNITYLLEAASDQTLYVKEDENSDVKWIPLCDLEKAVSEKEMLLVYKKIIERIALLFPKDSNESE